MPCLLSYLLPRGATCHLILEWGYRTMTSTVWLPETVSPARPLIKHRSQRHDVACLWVLSACLCQDVFWTACPSLAVLVAMVKIVLSVVMSCQSLGAPIGNGGRARPKHTFFRARFAPIIEMRTHVHVIQHRQYYLISPVY